MTSATVVIVGAGPAGVRAAEVMVAAGIRPILIDEGLCSGGQIYRQQPAGFRRSKTELYGPEAAKADAIHSTMDRLLPSVDYRPNSLVWALWDGVLHVLNGRRTSPIKYDVLIVASGATDRVFPIPGWTKPGVYTLGAAQIALKAQSCGIGSRVIFIGSGPLLYLVAYQYLQVGNPPIAVLDTGTVADRLAASTQLLARPAYLLRGLLYIWSLRLNGVKILSGITPTAIDGGESVSALRFQDRRGRELTLFCDGIGFGYHLRAECQLADLAKVPFSFNEPMAQFLPECDEYGRTANPGIYLAGDGVQLAGADAAESMGRLAAYAALNDLGHSVDKTIVGKEKRRNARFRRFRDGLARAFPWPGRRFAKLLPDEAVICRCEVVTAGALRQTARALGSQEINRSKALGRVGMGRCQGRYCSLAATEILAAELGIPTANVGRLRGQAPVKPVPGDIEPHNG